MKSHDFKDPSARHDLRAVAAEQARLLKLIADTDHAASSLGPCKRQVTDIGLQAHDAAKKTAELAEEMDTLTREIEKYQNSRMKKMAYMLSGKKSELEARISEDQRQHADLISRHAAAEKRSKELDKLLDEAKEARAKLQKQADSNVDYQVRLETLQDAALDGPTANFAGEDEAELEVQRAKEKYDQVWARFYADDQLFKAMSQARSLFAQAQHQLNRALEESLQVMLPSVQKVRPGDAFRILPTTGAIARRELDDALRRAQEAIMEGTTQANAVFSSLGYDGVAPPPIPERDIVWNILLKNVVSDVMLRNEIKDAIADVDQMKAAMDEHCAAVEARLDGTRQESRDVQDELSSKRQMLVQIRTSHLQGLLAGDEAAVDQKKA